MPKGFFQRTNSWLFTIVIVLCFEAFHLNAQEVVKPAQSLQMRMHAGQHYYPGGDLADELDKGYYGIDLRYTWQARDKSNWSSIFNYANYGVGFFTGNVGDPSKLGTPYAVFGFMNFSLYRAKNVEVYLGPAFGMTFNLEPFDPVTNPQNNVIGAKMAAYFNASLSANFPLSSSLDLTVSGDFIHMSNGSARQPNVGIDMYGGALGLRWNFDRKKYWAGDYRALYPEKGERDLTRHSSFNIAQSFSKVQKVPDQGTNKTFLVATTQIEYQYHFNEIHGISGGIDIFFDESVEEEENYEEYNTKTFPGVHFGYDLHFWRMYIRPQIGYIVSKAGQNLKAGFFMRVQLRGDITDTLYAQVGVKTINGIIADWADIGLGVRLFKR